MASF
ncbi:4856a35c-0f46-4bd5-b615-9ad3c8b86fc2 [Thermothielavioides terrestris]|jgi:hypothetical protein